PRDIAARPIEALDQADANRITAYSEHDRDRRSGAFRRDRGRVASDSRDHRYLAAHEVSRQGGEPFVLPLRPPEDDRHALPFDIPASPQPWPERRARRRRFLRRSAAEESDHRHRWLLCPGRERPARRRAAEQRDELAPPHSITSSARASRVDGTARPSALAVL